MGVHKKLGNDICPECRKLGRVNRGRVKVVSSWNPKVKYSTKNEYGWFIHNDRSIKNCYIGTYDDYLEKQIENHPLKEEIKLLRKQSKVTQYLGFLFNKFDEKYVKSWPMTREEDKKLAAAIEHQRKVLFGCFQISKFMTDGLLLRISGAEIPKERLEEEKRLKLIFEDVNRKFEETDKLMVENPIQLLNDAGKVAESDPFVSTIYPLFRKYELPKRNAKREQINKNISKGRFGSEKYPAVFGE